jgi:hypothetical protein
MLIDGDGRKQIIIQSCVKFFLTDKFDGRGKSFHLSTFLVKGKVKLLKKVRFAIERSQQSRALVAHACNPSYSRGRDQKDCSSKPAQENSL